VVSCTMRIRARVFQSRSASSQPVGGVTTPAAMLISTHREQGGPGSIE
jgi:hypothetical protein